MLNLETLQNEANAGDEVRDLFADYKNSSSYICDAISERADARIDIYTHDLMEWAKSHIYECDEAIKEMGRSFNSITQVIQHAQFFENERELCDDLENGILWACYETAKEYTKEITEEQNQEIEELADSLDNNSRFDEITDRIALIFANNEE